MNIKIIKKFISVVMTGVLACGAYVPVYAASTGFSDVPSGAYYEDAVNWAVSNDVTKGTSASTFSPDADCTRAQMVTFLYNAFGNGTVMSGSSGFSDVSEGSYYCNAVKWAVARGITTGTGNGLFSPDEKCTRAQAVTFIYRAVNASDVNVASVDGFYDVQANDYFYGPVKWAVKDGIAQGTGEGAFSPEGICSRAQIVTFLYRFGQMQDRAAALLKANEMGALVEAEGSVMEEAVFYTGSGSTSALFDAYFDENRYVWDYSGKQVFIFESDGSCYGEMTGDDGSPVPFKAVFGNDSTKEQFLEASALETGIVRLMDTETLVKDIYTENGNTVLMTENPDATGDYAEYVDSGYTGAVSLTSTFRFSEGDRLTGMTANYRLGDGSIKKAMKTTVLYGSDKAAAGELEGDRNFDGAEDIKASLDSTTLRHLTWTVDPGMSDEHMVTETVAKGAYFYTILTGSTGLYTDRACTQPVSGTATDLDSDLTVYSRVSTTL